MQRYFRLDLKTFGEDGAVLHEAAGERPVSGHDVLDFASPEETDQPADQRVAETVAGTFVFRMIAGRKAVARYHVGFPFEDRADQFLRLVGRVG